MKGAQGATFLDLVKMVEDVRDRTVRIETAIAGDPVVGVLGLQARVAALERESGGRRLFRAMVAIGTFLGALVGAAAAPFVGHK